MDPGISTFRLHDDSKLAFQGLGLEIVAIVICSEISLLRVLHWDLSAASY
jgi:hypothetical protein